ncbi:hypothetical protein, conserved in T. vivax [Trypanosoma vivax Y486]|uniref:Uncharacterized protein n=1 Tax=Trypanosoma vivax (strain Y486) TaxID=1055687 RepID=F9WTN5_TRYVY|nr:hypothetical protein, conserved in T. vivax [Trypanosoma vivax Y486]|eukprot:CCD20929.1 hypothetical protein, conserved in T. vivax [Trypanosoma vivax Y486]
MLRTLLTAVHQKLCGCHAPLPNRFVGSVSETRHVLQHLVDPHRETFVDPLALLTPPPQSRHCRTHRRQALCRGRLIQVLPPALVAAKRSSCHVAEEEERVVRPPLLNKQRRVAVGMLTLFVLDGLKRKEKVALNTKQKAFHAIPRASQHCQQRLDCLLTLASGEERIGGFVN